MTGSTPSTGRWLDSLIWLCLAGILAALLVPPSRKHVTTNPTVRLAEKKSPVRRNLDSQSNTSRSGDADLIEKR